MSTRFVSSEVMIPISTLELSTSEKLLDSCRHSSDASASMSASLAPPAEALASKLASLDAGGSAERAEKEAADAKAAEAKAKQTPEEAAAEPENPGVIVY